MNRSMHVESTVKAHNLQVGQYIWYGLMWREIVSLDTVSAMDSIEPIVVMVRFRGDAADCIPLNGNDTYQVRLSV